MSRKKELILIEQEVNRLIKSLQNKKIDADKLNVAFDLVKDIAFMTIKTAELKKDITKNGMVEEYQNGANQFGRKKSSAFDCYCLFTKQKAALIKQLTDLLPDELNLGSEEDDFDNFIGIRSNKNK